MFSNFRIAMKKDKLELSNLNVRSFTSRLDADQMHQVKGGFYIIRGGRYTYRTRWTSVDIRSEGFDTHPNVTDQPSGPSNNVPV